jgi:uncharacterized membrane protein HdeD (DUF308 family)
MKIDKPTINWMAIIGGIVGIAAGITMLALGLNETAAIALLFGGAGLLFPVTYAGLSR